MTTRPATTTPEWNLYSDWCTARGLPALPSSTETITHFVRDVAGTPATRRRRIRVIRRAHAEAGLTLAGPGGLPRRLWRGGEGWMPLAEALAAIPKAGWPVGLRGRRDAFLLVLAGQLRLTRNQIRQLDRRDVATTDPTEAGPKVTILGRTIPAAEQPAECPACAVTRWLRMLAMTSSGGRAEARTYLTGVHSAEIAVTHDCQQPVDERWSDTWQLTPPIDQHGWIDDAAPISRRAISAIVRHRLTPTFTQPPASARGLPDDAAQNRLRPARSTERDHMALDELLDLLDEQAEAAGQVVDRVETALRGMNL